jgi:hypothetical protein
VHALKPLLDRFGNERNLSVILFNARRDLVFARAGAAQPVTIRY